MLLVRLASWQFVATQDSAGVGTFRTNAANARTALAGMQAVASPEVAPLIAPVQTALAAYEASLPHIRPQVAVAALTMTRRLNLLQPSPEMGGISRQ